METLLISGTNEQLKKIRELATMENINCKIINNDFTDIPLEKTKLLEALTQTSSLIVSCLKKQM